MNSTKFRSICEMLFGRSWQAQVADNLMISRKTVSSWLDRGSIPTWVDSQIKPLVTRRAKEVSFVLTSIESSEEEFLHAEAILKGRVHNYNPEKYNFNDVIELIENQKYSALDSAKYLIREGRDQQFVLDWVESYFLSEHDIASYLEHNDVAHEDINEIQNMRGDACSDVCSDVENIFERINK